MIPFYWLCARQIEQTHSFLFIHNSPEKKLHEIFCISDAELIKKLWATIVVIGMQASYVTMTLEL